MGSLRLSSRQQLHSNMKLTYTVKKVLEKINNTLAKERKHKFAQLDQHVATDNFLNESFEEEIEDNLRNEQLEARLAHLLAVSPSSEQTRLRLEIVSNVTVSVISGCQQAAPQQG